MLVWRRSLLRAARARAAHTEARSLFDPLTLSSDVTLSHRVVLAPLTRNRASEPELAPHGDHIEYYKQRTSSGGLLITEATCISPEAVGYPSVPGIWTEDQVNGWKEVTTAVHDEGGKIFMQLWHTGRVAQPSFGEHPLLKGSGLPLPSVSSSEMPLRHPKTGELLTAFTYAGKETCAVPRPLATSEIPRLLDDYRRACENALRAGFDGVELHAAHGYLIDQFLQDGVNKRTDEYGGTVNNRCRLLFEATGALVDIAGQGRVGVRLSPTTIDASGRQSMQYYAASSTDPDAVYEHAVGGLNRWKLAYLLLSEPRWNGRNDGDVASDPGFSQPLTNAKYRGIYDNTLMAAGGFTPASAAQAVADGTYDLVAFGRWFLSNPDLPERLRSGAPLNVYDRQTFYTPTILGKDGRKGYVDYPDMGGTIGETGKYPLMEQHRIGTSLGATPTKTEGGATSS